mmetsp:Transcript_13205/g.25039  ORF Transcript_13205/g.25039 Transcript_13205/m.25039 type:complete len:752 (-) Transcript_13205:223-2478(-)
MSRRLNRHKEPPYDFSDVPDCKHDLEGSVVVKIQSRQQWFSSIGELVQICNEAVRRQRMRRKFTGKAKDAGKPLSLFYIADRLDTDDPIYGYMVRTKKEGWLQGFVITTTFTTWQRWFKWDSLIPCAGIVDKKGGVRACNANRKVDENGEIARQLSDQFHHGDPLKEGIMWPRVAEISLVGALGCGGWLVSLVLEEMEAENQYDWVVLQALDNSIGFYERMGFTRVGAIARYYQEDSNGGKNDGSRRERGKKVATPSPTTPRGGRTVGYRHWTWDDESINQLPKPSYMMARKLNRQKIEISPSRSHAMSLARGRARRKGRGCGRSRKRAKDSTRIKGYRDRLKELLVTRPPAIKVTKKRNAPKESPENHRRGAVAAAADVEDDDVRQEHLWAWEGAVPKSVIESHRQKDDDSSSSEPSAFRTPKAKRHGVPMSSGRKRPGAQHSSSSEALPDKRRKFAQAGSGRRGEDPTPKSKGRRKRVTVKWHLDVKLVWKNNPSFKPRQLRITRKTTILRHSRAPRDTPSSVARGGRGTKISKPSAKKKKAEKSKLVKSDTPSSKKSTGHRAGALVSRGDRGSARDKSKAGKVNKENGKRDEITEPSSSWGWAKRGRGGRRFGGRKSRGRGRSRVPTHVRAENDCKVEARKHSKEEEKAEGHTEDITIEKKDIGAQPLKARRKRLPLQENKEDFQEKEETFNTKPLRGVDAKTMKLHGREILSIRQMGFRDNKKIVDALRRCNGNLHVALEALIAAKF